MFSRPSGVGCASGCDDGVAGVVAWLLVHGQVADVVSSVSSRRSRLVGRGEERTVFVPGSVLAICRLVLVLVLVLVVPSRRRGSYPWRLASMSCPSCLILFACYHYLVSSCFSFLISSCVSLQSSCLRCVFLVFFSSFAGVLCLLYLSPCPSRSIRLVASSRRASRAAAGIVMCLLDLLPMAFSSRSYRLVGRDGERDGTMIFRNRFHDIFMYSESIAVNIGHPI